MTPGSHVQRNSMYLCMYAILKQNAAIHAVLPSWCVSFQAATYILDDPRALGKDQFFMLY